MDYGNIESQYIDGLMQVIYDSGEIGSAVTSVTISSLNGDVDEDYLLLCRFVNGFNGATFYYAQMNSDSGTNYGRQYLDGTDTTVTAARVTNAVGMGVGYASTQNYLTMSSLAINAKSGYIRTGFSKYSLSVNTTTVTQAQLNGWSWNNTADNITSIKVTADQTNGIGVGSRIILLRKVTATTGALKTGVMNVKGKVKYAWQEIYSNTLSGAATSVTISSLTGNTDVIYRLRVRLISGYAGASNVTVRPNNDSGTNYGYQRIKGETTNAVSDRATNATSLFRVGTTAASADVSFSEMIIFAKSGYVRTALASENGYTVTTTVGSVTVWDSSWNNTADEITSLVILSSQTNGLGIGTEIVLERLNL